MKQSPGESRSIRYVDLLDSAVSVLKDAGIEEPEIDARLLLEAASGLSRTGLLLRASEEIDPYQIANFQNLLKRRLKREPVAYILGEKEFWSLPFL